MLITITEDNKEPVLMLTGSDLLKNGFKVGDIVNVSFSDNEIVICKNEETAILQQMNEKNPMLSKFIEELNLRCNYQLHASAVQLCCGRNRYIDSFGYYLLSR